MKSVGIDCEEVERFRALCKKGGQKDAFIRKVFSEEERVYCFAYRDPAVHLAGTFAAKEAAVKAAGICEIERNQIEVRRTKDGVPKLYVRGKKSRIQISITHTRDLACAVAFV